MKKLLKFKTIILFIALFTSSFVYSHSIQLAYGTSCNGKLRLWIEHWHGTQSPAAASITVILNGTTITSSPSGAVYGIPLNLLPGSPAPFAACPMANNYEDWIYYDFNVSCGSSFTLTVISGNNTFTQDDCGMFPATISGIVSCNPINITTTGVTSICNGSSAMLTAAVSSYAGGTFVWNNTITGNIINVSPSSTTTYTVTYTSLDGCISTATTTVTVITPSVGAIANPGNVCKGDPVILFGSGANSYTWSGGVTNGVSFIPSTTTTYTVTGSNITNGCSTATITVVVNPIVTANATATAVCAGSPVTLTGSGGASYSWSGGVTNGISFVPNATTTYTVTGTNTNSCSNTATITVAVNPLPTIIASATANAICAGTSIILTGSGANLYAWTGGVINGNAFTPSSTNTYTVTGTDANNCSGTATKTIIVDPLPIVTANASATNIFAGTPVTLTGSGAASYSWSGGVTNGVSFIPNATATYTVTGTTNSCSSTATITIIVNPSINLYSGTYQMQSCSLKLYDEGGANQNYSNNSSKELKITSFYNNKLKIVFNSFQTYNSNDYLEIYNVVGTNKILIGKYFGSNLPPTITSSGNTIVFKFKSNTSLTSFGWNADITCATVALRIDNDSEVSTIENLNTQEEKINVYPNPSNGQFNFTGLQKESIIEIYDVTGRLIYHSISQNTSESIDLSDKEKGIYFYKIINDKKEIQQGKIIIQ